MKIGYVSPEALHSIKSGNGTAVIQARSVKTVCRNPVLKAGLCVHSPRPGAALTLCWGSCLQGGSVADRQGRQCLGSKDMGCRDRGEPWGLLGSSHSTDIMLTRTRKQNGVRKVQELVMETRTSSSPHGLSSCKAHSPTLDFKSRRTAFHL